MQRDSAELVVYAGQFKLFEWYWDANDEMPGLDAYEQLDEAASAAFLAALDHWGNLAPGQRPLESRVATENDDPLILAVKAMSHRFLTFHAGNDLWIIAEYYKKKGQKLGKTGKRSVAKAIGMLTDYENRVARGKYYERN